MKLGEFYLIILLTGLSTTTVADEIVHGFKNPSFSGIGSSAHYLTVENQEKSRRDEIQDDIESALKAAEREESNSTLAKFIRNLESRIYAQLSKQLVDNMFGNEAASMMGSFSLEGNEINYERSNQCDSDGICEDVIVMTITDSEGSTTTITIPVGTGGF
jgi:hypothetical protein|tara:strand:- start:1943 stop:2422 length:480 start_codon:yes stop_codon:yes gene_type:complete